MKITRFADVPCFTRPAGYEVDLPWTTLKSWLAQEIELGLDLDPDFQRGHVWSEAQQIRYVEYRLRGGTMSGRHIFLNCPGFRMGHRPKGSYVLVDGKQRLEAVRRFLDNEIPAFGSLFHEFTDRLGFTGPNFRVCINDLKTRAEVLGWYLDLNAGGVVHSDGEIARVRALLAAEDVS